MRSRSTVGQSGVTHCPSLQAPSLEQSATVAPTTLLSQAFTSNPSFSIGVASEFHEQLFHAAHVQPQAQVYDTDARVKRVCHPRFIDTKGIESLNH